MKNETLFYKTIDILVKAYQSDSLNHGSLCECAIGNMIIANMHIDKNDIILNSWHTTLCCGIHTDEGIKQIESTGYSYGEVGLIEKSFEIFDVYDDPDGYHGAMMVVDTLMQIHEATTEETESAKLQFVKA